MTAHRAPLYCPYCGDQDLFPVAHGTVEQGPVEHADAWECRSCTRVFAVRSVSPSSPSPTATANTEVTR